VSDPALKHYAEMLRTDFAAFAHRAFAELFPGRPFESNWHIEVIAAKLEAVRTGKTKRLIINVPPRSLKSYLGSTAFPAYILGHNPSVEILCTSYGQEFANSLALPCRQLMDTDFYKSLFATRLSEDRQAVEEFKTTAGGVRRAVSWSGALMGRGADYLIIDDPLKVDDANSDTRRAAINEAYHSAVATRLNRETGAVILIMQRLHYNDLSAFVQKSEDWEVLAIPALAEHDEKYAIQTIFGQTTLQRRAGEALQPFRQSAASLRALKIQKGAAEFDAQYQQDPHGAEGALVLREWLSYYDDNTKPAEFELKIQSWDTATKGGDDNSYSVCTTWGLHENKFYLLDRYRGRPNFRELKTHAISLANEYQPTTILIEDQSSGPALQQELTGLGWPAEAVPQTAASKTERLHICINKFEAGLVILPRNAVWLEEYVGELTTFPGSEFSDQVDSTTQALIWGNSSTNRGWMNAMSYMGWAGGEGPLREKPEKVKIRILEGGGEMQFHDGSGRPTISIGPTGSIMEVDRDILGVFLQQWKKFKIVN
jgi:predicted phage terminase large subunit-like protein